MAQPVWILSVDLQTKTATFQTGLADAAKAARGSFNDIKGGAGEMGGAVNYSMSEARHGVMLLGEEFGIHLPRALTSFIASIGPVGAALEAAFPFLAIAVGATLLIEHLGKLREAGAKLTEDQIAFGTAVNNAFNALDQKILQAQIHADQLRNDHLGALRLQLELIDKQSMAELVHSFDLVAKSADVVLKDLEGHWYQMGIGSDGAKAALMHFKTEYESLLSQPGKEGEAHGLLTGTLVQAERVRDLMKQAKTNHENWDTTSPQADATIKELTEKTGRIAATYTKEEIASQDQLVLALQKQVEIEARVATLKKLEGDSARKGTQNNDDDNADKLLKAQAASERTGLEIAEKIRDEAYKRALADLEESEHEQLIVTEKGSMERLSAINDAIAKENAYGLQETGFYRSMLTQWVETARQYSDEYVKLKAEAAREDADNTEKMGILGLAAEKQSIALEESARRVSAQQRIADESKVANDEYAIKAAALAKEIAGLDKSGKDYENKLKQLQDKETQLTRQHENEITAIKEKAEIERDQRVLASFNSFNNSISQGLTQSIMGHQTWAKMAQSLGDQVVSGMIQNAIKSMIADDMTKEKDAAHAARKAFNIGMEIGGPAGIVLGPVFGAAAFAAVMAFEGGTDRVPGVGRGDIVPSLLSPGEGVVPGGVMDGLRNMARSGGFEQGPRYHVTSHVHIHASALDADGMDKVLEKNSGKLQRHFEGVLRKMNK